MVLTRTTCYNFQQLEMKTIGYIYELHIVLGINSDISPKHNLNAYLKDKFLGVKK
jgi:hypothetical protein